MGRQYHCLTRCRGSQEVRSQLSHGRQWVLIWGHLSSHRVVAIADRLNVGFALIHKEVNFMSAFMLVVS